MGYNKTSITKYVPLNRWRLQFIQKSEMRKKIWNKKRQTIEICCIFCVNVAPLFALIFFHIQYNIFWFCFSVFGSYEKNVLSSNFHNSIVLTHSVRLRNKAQQNTKNKLLIKMTETKNSCFRFFSIDAQHNP